MGAVMVSPDAMVTCNPEELFNITQDPEGTSNGHTRYTHVSFLLMEYITSFLREKDVP